jgi:hypothetical protein
MVGLYQDGFAVGNRDGLNWAIDTVAGLATKAKTSHGQAALKYAAQLIMEERDRKFPPEDGGSDAG